MSMIFKRSFVRVQHSKVLYDDAMLCKSVYKCQNVHDNNKRKYLREKVYHV